MTRPRSQLISLEDTPYYHCIARCVRRANLCGDDPLTGRSFDHRRQWIVDRLKRQAAIFCIDICAYAVMSNHYHVVLHVNQPRCDTLSDREVAERWSQLFSGSLVVQRFLQGENLSDADDNERQAALLPFAERERLDSVAVIPFHLRDYLLLADWTGRAVRDDKRGAIRNSIQPPLQALGLNEDQWQALAIQIQRHSLGMLGSLEKVRACNTRMGRRWMAGQSGLGRIYRQAA